MAGLEGEIFSNTEFQPLLWLHYLDDIFCIWTEGLEKPKKHHQYFNNFDKIIKFTLGYLYKEMYF